MITVSDQMDDGGPGTQLVSCQQGVIPEPWYKQQFNAKYLAVVSFPLASQPTGL